MAADLAGRGAEGPPTVLEGRFGLFHAFIGAEPGSIDLAEQLADLGRRWETPRIAYKPYPVCHFIHGSLGATAGLLDAIDPAEIESIEVSVPAPAVPIVLEPVADKVAPRTDYDGKFSLQFSTAAMLLSGRVDVRTFAESTLRDPAVLDLARKVSYVVREYETWPAAFPGGVRIVLRGGRTLEADQPNQLGGPENPMSTDQIVAKFRANAELALGDADVEALETALLELDEHGDVAAALAPLQRAAPAAAPVGASDRGGSVGGFPGQRGAEHGRRVAAGQLHPADRDRRPAEEAEDPRVADHRDAHVGLPDIDRRHVAGQRRRDVQVGSGRGAGTLAPARQLLVGRRDGVLRHGKRGVPLHLRVRAVLLAPRRERVAMPGGGLGEHDRQEVRARGSSRASTRLAPSASSSASRSATSCPQSVDGAPPGSWADVCGGRSMTPTKSPSSRASGTGSPLRTAYARAQSATVRAIGPATSKVGESSRQPSIGTTPCAGLKPTVAQQAEGMRSDPAVSVPRPSSPTPAAERRRVAAGRAAGHTPGRTGLPTTPQCGFWLVVPHANSCRFALAMTIAPASSSSSTAAAVRSGTCSA